MFLNLSFWIILFGLLTIIYFVFKFIDKMKKSRIDKRIE